MDSGVALSRYESSRNLHHLGTGAAGTAGQILMLPRRPTMTGRSHIVWTVLLLGFVLRAGVAFSADLKFPPLTGRVVDDAGILSPSTISELDEMLAQHEHTTIGQKGKNNGAILIVAPNEHKVRVEVGYGLEGQLTDAASRVIIENYITPQFRKGDFNAGVLAGTGAILRALGDDAAANLHSEAQPIAQPSEINSPSFSPLLWLLLIVIILFIVSRRSRYPYVMRRGGPYLGPGGGFGGGSSGGSGFAGGGGSFGGGGASGSW